MVGAADRREGILVRRFLALLFVMATLLVVPAVPATAHEHRVEVTILTEEVAVGVSDDGATLTAGTYQTLFQGIVVATGTVYGTYYDRGSGVHGTRHFIEDVNGQETVTEVKPLIVDVDDSGDPVVITYEFTENIVAQSFGHHRPRLWYRRPEPVRRRQLRA